MSAGPAAGSEPDATDTGGWKDRLARLASRLSIRLLAFNLLLVFLPAAGVLYLGSYEKQLLKAQERSMVQQGRLLAAALSGRGELDGDEAQRVLGQLGRRVDARLRVVDRDGRVLADSSLLGPRREAGGDEPAAATDSPRDNPLYRLGTTINRIYRTLRPIPEPPSGTYSAGGRGGVLDGPAVREALGGAYGADFRVGPGPSGRAVSTLYSAIPVTGEPVEIPEAATVAPEVVGAVLVSQSTARVLSSLIDVRLSIFKVFLLSVAAAVVLTLLVGTTIVRPLHRLSDQARALVDRRGRLTGHFRENRRRDEIGDLSRALAQLTRRLAERSRFTESFAADVSHEFKNPLASIRTAAEMLPEVEGADRERFVAMIQRDCARLEHLLSGVREISAVDTELEAEGADTVPLAELTAAVIDGYRLRREAPGPADGEPPAPVELSTPGEPLPVTVPAERLSQVVENLIDNAVSFSPEGRAVEVTLERRGRDAILAVRDRGPGIPPEHLGRIFDRFFSYRPADRRDGHTGLGLAIARAIVEGCGGSIRAANREGGGTEVSVRLPLAE